MQIADDAPVWTLAQVRGGAPNDRPVYVLGEVPVGAAWRAVAGPHAGALLYLRKVRRREGGHRRLGSVQCARCRARWSFIEYDDPADDPYRWRPPQ